MELNAKGYHREMNEDASPIVSSLSWPLEMAGRPPRAHAILTQPGSNIILDLHGDPCSADLVVFSDGNHHMALADCLHRFAQRAAPPGGIFYATAPPGLLAEALEEGCLRSGNLMLRLRPHLFIGPEGVLAHLAERGHVARHRLFMHSRGVALLVRKGNPKGITGLGDILRKDVRLALSNPESEAASFGLYRGVILRQLAGSPWPQEQLAAFLESDAVVKSQVIHHREIPELLAADCADVSLVYHHLALRYVRIFPEHFDLVALADDGGPEAVATYHAGIVGDGGAHGNALLDFLCAAEAQAI
ncbi:MAG: ABC transporter substrate-binding protein, partial [Alphaproteobacteria bacterium]